MRSLSMTMARLRRVGDAEGPTLREISDHVADRSLPILILVFGIIATVPTPGLPFGLVFGSLVVLLAAQHLVGLRSPFLPGAMARRRIPRGALDAVLRRSVPMLRRIERRLKPRAAFALSGAANVVSALLLMVLGFLVALPIPFGNAVPGIAIIALALGLSVRDGLGVLVGWGAALGALAFFGGLVWGAGDLVASAL